ncbi:hypothetical protein EV181_002595 [Coemansia sp. RSA 532]|nr:hypothetical protein EV181_002595 [Coemansia sp. RSA 532]
MSPRNKAPVNTRPQTPSGLGLGSTNVKATMRSVSSSSSVSAKGEAPCFHTNRPQFISSHIDRCEACRLKYARQAEQTTIPYVPTSARRTSGVNQPRSLSRQSVNTGNRPSSSASVGGAAASSMGATTGQNNSNTQRPSSRASVASVASVASAASRLQDAGGRPLRTTTHVRSSSAGAPLLDARANTRRAIARAAEEAMAESGSLPSPPPRGDPIHAAGSSSDTPASPTETVASRSRSRAGRGAKANVRDLMSGAARGRRGSTQSVNSMRRTDSASPTRRIRSNQRPSTAAMPRFDVGNDQPVDMTTAIIGSLVSSARDRDKSAAEKDFEIAQLLKENERLRHMQQQKQAGTATSAESTNIFDPNSADARQKAQERALMHDRVALDKFDEFRRAYEDCEPSLRTNRAQFAGERPLSPPPARPWGSVTPMRTDNGDHDQRLATLAAAEVRRAGEDLMSTPVRRTGRTLRGTSTRRRAVRPLFAGDSELSEDDSDDSDSDEHATLRNCLMSASNFGTFLVQYVTRQCLDHNALSEDYKAKQLRLEELEKRAAQLDKLNRRLEDSRDEHVEQAYEMSQQREQLDEALDTAERTVRRMANENDTLKHDLAQSNERGQTLEDQVSRLNEQLVKARQRCEHDVAAARRVTGAHQQDNVRLSKENEELRGEMKGKLQRAGLKSNVDEYMAGRRKEAASASAVIDAGAQPATETDGAAAESEIKRLQESVQFWRKKTDRVGRKLRSEQAAKKEAHRMLRVQQEETMRYEQLFGPLSDDVGAEPAESLGAYLPSFSGSLENLPEMDGSEAESDVLSNAGSDALIEAVAGESIETGVKTPRMTRMASQSSLSSEGDAPAQAEAEADDQDIRRYEQRMRNRRTATARPMRRRSRPNALAVATGESLGDILGVGSQWGDPTSARSRQGTARGVSSLAAELDAMDFQPSPPLMARSLSNASPVTRPRARSFRGAPPPFGEAPVSAGFGIGFDASVSLAEQFAAAARRPSTTLGRPQTADVGTETVPMSMVVSNVRSVGVDSHLSENAAVAAVSEMRSVEVEPQVSDSMHVNGAVQAAPTTAVQACATDPLVGMSERGVDVVVAATTSSVQAEPAVAFASSATDVSTASARHAGVDSVASVGDIAVQAMPEVGAFAVQAMPQVSAFAAQATPDVGVLAVQAVPDVGVAATETDPSIGVCGVGVSTDPSIGMVSAGMSTDPSIGVASVGLSAIAAVADRALATDRMEGMADCSIEAVSEVRNTGMVAGSQPLADAAVATNNPSLIARGSDALHTPTVNAGTSAQLAPLCNVQAATDDAMLAAWLMPLIPDGISTATVLRALARQGRPVYEIVAEQEAEAARLAAAERALLAEQAADNAAAEAAANAKVFINRGTGPETFTGEFSVQVEPSTANKPVQAGLMATVDAGIDAAPGPVLMSVGTATGARPVDRWVEPFDPVARFDRSTDAGVATAARATSHDFESVDAAVGPVCESRDASASSATQSAAAGTTMDIVSADRAACVELELHDQMVQAGESLTMETGTSTAVLTADRVGEPAFVLADHAMSCNVLSCDQLVEAGLEPLQAVGTSTSVEVADVATEQTAASSVNVMVEAAPASNVAVSTADVSVLAADVAVSTVSDTASRSLAVSTMETSTMSTSTMATSTMTASVMATPTMAVATMATSTMAEKASQDTAVSTFTQGSSRSMAVGTDVGAAVSAYTQTEDIPDLHSLPTRLTRAPYGQSPMGSVDSLGSVMGVAPIVGRSLQSVVPRTRPPVPSLAAFAKKQSPRIPLPPLPLQSTSLPGTARFSGARSDLAVNLPRSMSARDVPLARDMPGTPERESDHEDYGYIMVSPRTHVQCVPVPTLSSRTSSLAKPASQDMQLGEANAASLSSRGLGCDDSAADDVSEEVRPARFGTTRAMALQAEDLTPKRSSVSIGVEANMQDQQALTARQPEPLIVQSIARAMVGGHMYKYTPTRFTHNTSRERRHLRYFWIHPYAKLLNWSRQPPSGGVGMARSNRENGGRCVFIRDVRIVDEPHGYADDPNEPSYCIVVSTDHREIKLKATTKSDHDLWFMAMSYLQSRRIITSTTYPAATVAGAASAGYQSDDSAQSRGTSMDSTQRVIMQADRRERHERSRSRNRTAIGSLLGRPPLPPPRPESSSVGSVATTTDSIAPGSVVLPSNASSFEQPPASVHPHRSTLDGTPSRVHSLQSTPRSLRPVSMAMTPGSSDKRLSMGLFRKMGGGGSHTSLFRHGTRTSEDQGDAPSPSIALVMNNATESPSKGSVRKMFSGSFLRALRSRESVVDDDP